MGICASSQFTRKGGSLNWPATAKIIHPDGTLQELTTPTNPTHLLSHYPNHFLCSSESMYIGSLVPHVPLHQDLQMGHLYFLLPSSFSHSPLSLQQLCSLAIKASAALSATANAAGTVPGDLCKATNGFRLSTTQVGGGATKELSSRF